MKFDKIQFIFYIILFLFLVRFLYYLYLIFSKNMLINEILYEWIKQTKGSFKKQTEGVYTDDYFLSFTKEPDQETHVHLITDKFYSNFKEFFTTYFYPNFEIIPTVTVGYVVKKNNTHLTPVRINQQNDAQMICKNIIEMYKNY